MISKYITLDQAIKSQTAIRKGIDNTPNAEQIEAMKHVALNVYDKVYEKFKGVTFNSFFRSPKLNKAIGGSATSQHCKGEAIDIDSPTDNIKIFDFIRQNLNFDQTIAEYPDANGNFAWVHVSLKKSGNRKQVLVKLKDKYIDYSTYKIGMI